MGRIVQCVPNFSEGRRRHVVEAIVQAAREASSVRIVDYSWDSDHNRMVLTMLGNPGEIRDSMFAAAKEAVARIDMNEHSGVHPRIGAVDVVPLVAIKDISADECIDLSYQVGNDIAAHLGVPVYFYEMSAVITHRANLADVRRGGYERLMEVGMEGDRIPDLGPHKPHPTAGAAVVGVRGSLVAYNIILDTRNIEIPRLIAQKLRMGQSNLKGIKALGFWLESRSKVQVSMNLTRPDLTPLYHVFRFVSDEAHRLGVDVEESEIIGTLPACCFDGTTPQEIKAHSFRSSQVLDNWIQDA